MLCALLCLTFYTHHHVVPVHPCYVERKFSFMAVSYSFVRFVHNLHFILLLIDIWVVSRFLTTYIAQIFLCMYEFLLDIKLEVELLGHRFCVCLVLGDTTKEFSAKNTAKVVVLYSIS